MFDSSPQIRGTSMISTPFTNRYGDALVGARVVPLSLDEVRTVQALRIGRLRNDPSDELEPEDKEVLIGQVLDLEWPEAVPGGRA